jgi:hypothetical protein
MRLKGQRIAEIAVPSGESVLDVQVFMPPSQSG